MNFCNGATSQQKYFIRFIGKSLNFTFIYILYNILTFSRCVVKLLCLLLSTCTLSRSLRSIREFLKPLGIIFKKKKKKIFILQHTKSFYIGPFVRAADKTKTKAQGRRNIKQFSSPKRKSYDSVRLRHNLLDAAEVELWFSNQTVSLNK